MKNTAIFAAAGLFVASFEKLELVLRVAALLMPLVVGIVQILRRPKRRVRREPKRVQSYLPLLGVLVLVMLSGCVTRNTAAVLRELRQDTNSVSLDVSTPWGSVHAKRN